MKYYISNSCTNGNSSGFGISNLAIYQKEEAMAKYTTTIDEETRQRILALPRGVHFSDFIRKAISVFIEKLEQDINLKPEDFIITRTERKDASDKKRT
jgi:hypothetical protein